MKSKFYTVLLVLTLIIAAIITSIRSESVLLTGSILIIGVSVRLMVWDYNRGKRNRANSSARNQPRPLD